MDTHVFSIFGRTEGAIAMLADDVFGEKNSPLTPPAPPLSLYKFMKTALPHQSSGQVPEED